MQAVKIEQTTQEAILKVMAAVLHLGNISFLDTGNGAQVENEDSEYEVVCESIVLTEMLLTYFLIFVIVLVAPSNLLNVPKDTLKETLMG